MTLIPSKECLKLQTKDMAYLPKKELCAGNKVYIRPLPRYVKYANGTLAKDPLPLQNDITSKTFYLGKSLTIFL